MNKEQLMARVEEVKKALEQSAANHNALLGRLAEAEHILKEMDTFCETILDAAHTVSNNTAPVTSEAV